MSSLSSVGNLIRDRPVTLQGHSDIVLSVAFSPSDQLLASGSKDTSIRLWNVVSGANVATLTGHSELINSVAFSPDGTMLASGANDIKLWDVESWVQVITLKKRSSSVAFSPDSAWLASGSLDSTVELWDVRSRTSVRILKGHSDGVDAIAFSPDGKTIASGARDHTVRLWDVESGAVTTTLKGHPKDVMAVTFSPDGELLASGCDDANVRLWNVATGSCIATLRGHSALLYSVAFSPNGKYLASAAYDQAIRLWDVASRTNISTLKDHSRAVGCVTFSHNGTHLASGSWDKTIKIWNISSGESSDTQDTIFTSSSSVLTQSTITSRQDTTTPASISVPPNSDITGSVSLEGSTPIGYGGFGDLFMGVHKNYGKVAMKKPRRVLDEALIRRFLREVNLWCSVSHPHILPCFGMCKIGIDVYVVSPFIENGDLLSCMSRGMDLNRSKLLFEVAEALTHLHHRGIVHGDVKAQNILLASDGSALLCDFGMAKAFDTMVTSTESKGAGSLRWMPPELFLGEGRSMASDVYSLGITIAEVLSGRAPYHDITENVAVMFHVVSGNGRPPKEPSHSPKGKSYATLWATAEACWVKDLKARPSMAQVLAMLFPLTREMR